MKYDEGHMLTKGVIFGGGKSPNMQQLLLHL